MKSVLLPASCKPPYSFASQAGRALCGPEAGGWAGTVRATSALKAQDVYDPVSGAEKPTYLEAAEVQVILARFILLHPFSLAAAESPSAGYCPSIDNNWWRALAMLSSVDTKEPVRRCKILVLGKIVLPQSSVQFYLTKKKKKRHSLISFWVIRKDFMRKTLHYFFPFKQYWVFQGINRMDSAAVRFSSSGPFNPSGSTTGITLIDKPSTSCFALIEL